MTDIRNKQTISITNSSGVTIGNIENKIDANKTATDEKEAAPPPPAININTGGGSYIEGNVQAGGDFAGNTMRKSETKESGT